MLTYLPYLHLTYFQPEFPWTVGHEFRTHLEAKESIQAWSLKTGFDIRIGSKKNLTNGQMSKYHRKVLYPMLNRIIRL